MRLFFVVVAFFFIILFYFFACVDSGASIGSNRLAQTKSRRRKGESARVGTSFFFGLFSLSLFLSFFLSFYRVISIAALDFVSDLVVVLYWVLT